MLALYSTLLKGDVVFWTLPECKVYVRNERERDRHAIRLDTTACGFEFVQVIEFAQVQYGPATQSQRHWQCKIGREFVAGRDRESRFQT